jgi:hypothetical protein
VGVEMNTYKQIDIYTTVSFVCNDPEREAYWLSLFFNDLEILLPSDLEAGVNEISKELVFDHHPMPAKYLKQIGMSFEELEDSEEVIYHQYLWTLVGNFETDLDSESFKEYLKKNTKLDFGFAEHIELVNGEQIRTANALQIVGGLNCYALDITALKELSTAELKSTREREEISKWTQITKKYGDFVIVDNPADIKGIDPKRVWTEIWLVHQVIVNRIIEVEEFNTEISSYYVFEKPYIELEGSLLLVTTIWEACDCGGDEDCSECEGQGSVATDLV